MDRLINYLLFEKKNDQAASNMMDDFETVIVTLTHAAESFKVCENQHLIVVYLFPVTVKEYRPNLNLL